MKHIKQYENFIGIGSSPTRRRVRKLKAAEEMERRGASNEEIRLATGWFRNEFDKQWRFEVTINQVKVKPIPYTAIEYVKGDGRMFAVVLLGDLLRDTSLLNDYPELLQTQVVLYPWRSPKASAEYGSLTQDIYMYGMEIDKQKVDEESEDVVTFTPSNLNTLMHEIQHAIQHIEGFANGSMPSMFRDVVRPGKKTLTPHDQYSLTAGEIEAREVEHRTNLPKYEKEKISVWILKDVPDAEDDIDAYVFEDPVDTLYFHTLIEAQKYLDKHRNILTRKYKKEYGQEYKIYFSVGSGMPTKTNSKPMDFSFKYGSHSSRTQDKNDVVVNYPTKYIKNIPK